MERKVEPDFYSLKTRPVPSVLPCKRRGFSFERVPQPWWKFVYLHQRNALYIHFPGRRSRGTVSARGGQGGAAVAMGGCSVTDRAI